MEQFKAWWNEASSRDQLAVVVCGAIVGVYLLYLIILKPIHSMRDKQLQLNKGYANQLESVRSMASEWIAYRQENQGGSNAGGSLSRVVEDSLRRNELRFTGMDPIGSDGIRLRLEQVNFNNLLAWVNEMEVERGYQIKDLAVNSGSDAGYVSANLRVYRE